MADEPKPWEAFQGAAKPWEQFAAPKPWEEFSKPAQTEEAPKGNFLVRAGQSMLDWWKSQPSWVEQATEQSKRDAATDQAGGFKLSTAKERLPLVEGFLGSGLIKASPGVPAVAERGLKEFQKYLSPQSVSPEAGEAAGAIRSAGGRAARDTETTRAAMEPYHRAVNALPEPERLQFIDSVETGGQVSSKPAPPKPGMIRYYHGTASNTAQGFTGKTFVTPQYDYARNYRGGTNNVLYVDIPKDEAIARGIYDDINDYPRNGAIDDGAAVLKPFDKQTSNISQLQPLADALKDAAKLRENKLRALPSTSQMEFVDDYLAHFWQDPQAATKIEAARGGASKQGSGASLKKRTVPTYQEGIAAGLKPLTTDPIEITMRYVSSMDKFIAATEVLDTAKANGTVKYIRPKTMGASGHPDSFKVPDGYAPLQGRGARDATGAQAYAPEDWARVYNNFISRGFHGNAEAGKAYDALQGASNAITSMELGLSGYHAFTMANEAIISDVARGISNAVGGKLGKGAIGMIKAPGAFVGKALKGKKVEQVYLGRTPGTPDMRRIVDLQTQAGGRAVGKSYAPDYRFSSMGSYWTAFKRGALKQQMRESAANIAARPIVGTAKEVGKLIGRVMETVAQPIFEKYIPRIKNGAFYDTMHDWLEANPAASHEQQLAMARKIWDSIDNRFGEMVQDNIFWNKTLKQVAQLGMRSYSWNLGTVREIGGGALSAVRDPRKLSISHPDYDPRIAYVVAMPIVVATANAAYQYLKTGQAPESVDDLIAGRTGGTAPGFGGRGSVPERASLPGYQKDVLGWYNDWKQEAANKRSRGFQLGWEMLRGQDWQGHLLSDPNEPGWLKDYFAHVVSSMVPISVGSMLQGRKTGSAMGLPEAIMGIRPAPGFIQDPEGTERGLKRIRGLEYKREQKSERRQQSQYGGANE